MRVERVERRKKREMALHVKILVTSILANLVAYWFYEISKLSPFFFTNLPSMLTVGYLFAELRYEAIRWPWKSR